MLKLTNGITKLQTQMYPTNKEIQQHLIDLRRMRKQWRRYQEMIGKLRRIRRKKHHAEESIDKEKISR